MKVGTSPSFLEPKNAIGHSSAGDPSCVLCMPFDGKNVHTAFDYSCYGNHGSIIGATYRKDGEDWSLFFDGVDDFVDIPYDFGKPIFLTLSLRFKTATTHAGVLFGQANTQPPIPPTDHIPTIAILSDGRIRAEFWNGVIGAITTPLAYNDGTRHHVAFKGMENLQELFVNEVSIGSRSGAITHHWWTFSMIGAGFVEKTRGFPSTMWTYFNGFINKVHIYNRVQ